MFHLYIPAEDRIAWSDDAPYTVDGKPGNIPQGWVQLEDEFTEKPGDVPLGRVAQAYTEVDVETKKLRHLWRIVDAPLVQKTKLQLSDRMGEAQFAALKATMAAMAESPDPAHRRMASRWMLAIDIDPNDPETSAGLNDLVAAGVITTPIQILFAP